MRHQIEQGKKVLIYGPKNLLLRATGDSLKPRWLWFGVTDKCNSRCIFCDIWRNKPTKDVLTPEEIEKTLSDPIFRDVEYILNSGGEPILRRDLKEIILAEHKALPKARLQLSTNGLLPDRVIDVVKFAVEHGINIDVGTSLDAIGEEHDSMRGVKGNFEKVDWLLHELVALRENYGDKKISPTFGFTLIDRTLPFLEEVRAYAQNLGIDFLVQWYNQSSFYSNVGKDLTTVNSSMVKAIQSLPNPILREMWLKWLRGKSIQFQCFAMYTFCVLQCNGDVAPCLSLWDVKAGNVRESPPTAIWHSFEAKKARRIVKDCQGCLNSWGTGWSFASSFYPYLLFLLRHPGALVERMKERK
ncbi:GTP 3',8-cyclase [subsurface metagenome]